MGDSSRHPGARPTQGVAGENLIIQWLKRRGIKAERAGGHYPYDLIVGPHKVQVKTPRLTACPDAKGNPIRAHVASNIRPGASHLIVGCMDADRKRLTDIYVMPSSAHTGRTLTITKTKREQLAKWRGASELLKSTSKG